MEKKDLIEKLRLLSLNRGGDVERIHTEADRFLLDYIDDKEVEDMYSKIDKWYA